jgi:hypothetical protein
MHAYARALRWSFGTPPWRALADERVGASGHRAPPAVLSTQTVDAAA